MFPPCLTTASIQVPQSDGGNRHRPEDFLLFSSETAANSEHQPDFAEMLAALGRGYKMQSAGHPDRPVRSPGRNMSPRQMNARNSCSYC
jgi:hypothetical protein